MTSAGISVIAPEPSLDPVAQADQTETEEDQAGRGRIARAREQRHETCKFTERAGCRQRHGNDAGEHGEKPRPPGERGWSDVAHGVRSFGRDG
jgi:hypothetical protein